MTRIPYRDEWANGRASRYVILEGRPSRLRVALTAIAEFTVLVGLLVGVPLAILLFAPEMPR